MCPALHDALLGPGDRPGYLSLRVAPDTVRSTVFEHPEFQAFQRSIEATYSAWAGRAQATLLALNADTKPKQLLPLLAEDLLHTLAKLPLLDRYDVYQNLMDYWATTMQDDVYAVVAEGWKARTTKSKKGHYNSELVPRELVIARYLTAEQAALDEASAALEEATRQREELEEEYGAEDAVLADYTKDGKLDRKAIGKRLKAAGPTETKSLKGTARRGRSAAVGTLFADVDAMGGNLAEVDEELPPNADADAEELAALRAAEAAFEAEDVAKADLKNAEATLEAGLAKRYLALTPDEVRTLVVDDKWLATLHQGLSHELAHLSGTLARSLTDLAQRYAQPLPALEAEVAARQARVNSYLTTLGFSAN
ncbi:hypothetical protein [Hymenobacter qilianensis]|uniref:hypothetical protein n=1 Tax=Hymenobacter qilianensis TaxID=1385715 RepID=UPI001CB8BBF0|nr:hypothetical protein [Hymenobacter qilianensis]